MQEEPTPQARLRILVVEDSPMNRLLFQDLLELHGYAVETAGREEEGRAAVERERPDLLIVDMHLARADGVEFLRWAQSRPGSPRIPGIVVSASARPGDRDRALAAGAVAFVAKPINVREFPDIVAKALQTKLSQG